MSFLINIFKFILIIIISSCSQTQLATHVTKQIFKESDVNKKKSSIISQQKPIYKIGNPYFVNGIKYVPKEENNYYEIGIASWYGPNFHGKLTANGEIFDQYDITAAHKTLPLPSVVRVTNLENNREIVTRINDRGPFVGNRIIDLSLKSAQLLGMKEKGTAKVSVELLDYGPHLLEKKNAITILKEFKVFFIQVGVFSKVNNADNFAEKLRNKKFIQSKVGIKTINQGEHVLYIVRIGPINDNEEASYVKRILEKNQIDSKIVQEPIS